MSKHVLVISTSLRKGNSERLAQEFAKGAAAAGHQVEELTLRGKRLTFCTGCMACLEKGHCVIPDDAVEIAAKMKQADVIAFATPIYYYEMSGQMKTLLDRANSLYGNDYKFTDIYMLTTAAEDEAFVPQRAVSGLQGWIDCFERASLKGSVFAGGVNAPGEIEGHPALARAFALGQQV